MPVSSHSVWEGHFKDFFIKREIQAESSFEELQNRRHKQGSKPVTRIVDNQFHRLFPGGV